MQTGRRAGVYISRKRREAENQMKREMFYKYIPEIAKALNEITKANEKDIKVKMEKLVLEKLQLEEAEEAKKLKVEDKLLEKNGTVNLNNGKKKKKGGKK